MTYEELKHFISEKMSLSHVYQPVMLKTLLLCTMKTQLLLIDSGKLIAGDHKHMH